MDLVEATAKREIRTKYDINAFQALVEIAPKLPSQQEAGKLDAFEGPVSQIDTLQTPQAPRELDALQAPAEMPTQTPSNVDYWEARCLPSPC